MKTKLADFGSAKPSREDRFSWVGRSLLYLEIAVKNKFFEETLLQANPIGVAGDVLFYFSNAEDGGIFEIMKFFFGAGNHSPGSPATAKEAILMAS